MINIQIKVIKEEVNAKERKWIIIIIDYLVRNINKLIVNKERDINNFIMKLGKIWLILKHLDEENI